MVTNKPTPKDRLSLRAFHAFYRMLYDLPNDERFLKAICYSSDEALSRAPRTLINKWIKKYSRRRSKHD